MTASQSKPSTLHVSLEGNDQWSGLIKQSSAGQTDGPLRTLAGVKERIRHIRQMEQEPAPIDVYFQSGRYEWTETVIFSDLELSNQQDAPIRIHKAAATDEVIWVGGAILQGWEKADKGIWSCSLSAQGLADLSFDQLFCNGVRQRTARYPKYVSSNPYGGGWAYVEGPAVNQYEQGHGERDRFFCKDTSLQHWNHFHEIELFVFPRHNWLNDIVKVKSYNKETGEVLLTRPAMYPIYPGDRFYFQNVREELTDPGEWYHDKQDNRLYFIPPAEVDPTQMIVSIPAVKQMVEINGTMPVLEDLNAEKLDWRDSGGDIRLSESNYEVKHGYIEFHGLTLEGCGGAAVVARHARGCVFSGCNIRSTRGVGIYLKECFDSDIKHCDIYDTGSHGVYVSGGKRSPFRQQYIDSGIHVENNYIHHIGVFRKNVAAIALNGVGIRIAHNYMHDGPRWGILSRGNNNMIEYNHIRHMNVETSDTAGIDLCDRDLTMNGTVIRYNRIHDMLGLHKLDGKWKAQSSALTYGIYLDDYTSGVEIYGNLIYRTPSGALYFHAGRENTARNNMFLETNLELVFLRRWPEDLEYAHIGTRGLALRDNCIEGNVMVTKQASSAIYYLDHLEEKDGKPDMDSNTIDHNWIWRFGHHSFNQIKPRGSQEKGGSSFEQWQEWGFDRNSTFIDPCFVDYDADQFQLRPDSPLLAEGFEPLPLEQMGLYQSEARASWPISEAEGVRERPLVQENERL
jgi:hypothetical protein